MENFVKNDDILYCGSHGLRIKGKTKGLDIAQFQIGQEYLPVLKMCAKEIKAAKGTVYAKRYFKSFMVEK